MPNQLQQIAIKWFDAFNTKNLEKLLELYDDEAQHFSPKLKIRQPETNGLIIGKEAMRIWWQDAFDRFLQSPNWNCVDGDCQLDHCISNCVSNYQSIRQSCIY